MSTSSPTVESATNLDDFSATVSASLSNRTPHIPTYQYDFVFLPIPKRLRYNPNKPFYYGTPLNVFFAICITLVCANLYYCQPILIQLSKSFSVNHEEVSRIPTLTQAGYGIGLLTIAPTGDMLRRRGLLLLLVLSSMSITIGLAITRNLYVFEVLSFLIGFTSVSPQIIISLAADLAPPERRAFAISLVSSGFMIGILISRVLSGFIANFVSWRYVYWMSVVIQCLVLIGSYLVLPDYPATDGQLSYLGVLCSMARLTVQEPLIVQILLITTVFTSEYTNFWVTLTFLLGGPPYHYSSMVIGLFGLFGLLTIVAVPLMGYIINRLGAWHAIFVTTLSLAAFQAIQLGGAGVNISAVVVACLGLEISWDVQYIALNMLLFSISETARSRLNSLVLISAYLGQLIGTAAGTHVFIKYGWRSNAVLVMGWIVLQFCILLLRGPNCPRQRWMGWHGGFLTKTSDSSAKSFGDVSANEIDCEKAGDLSKSPTCEGSRRT